MKLVKSAWNPSGSARIWWGTEKYCTNETRRLGPLSSCPPSLIIVGAGLGATSAVGGIVDVLVVAGVGVGVGFVVVAVVVDVVLK